MRLWIVVGAVLLMAACDEPEDGYCRVGAPGQIAVCIGDGGFPDGGHGCNLLTQAGCGSGTKCTWIYDQDDPPIFHVGCAPDFGLTAIPFGEECTEPLAGPRGYDTCAKGSICHGGRCARVCRADGAPSTCEPDQICSAYEPLSSVGAAGAGLCSSICEPLTQMTNLGSPACGSEDPATPTSGCFGAEAFACSPIVAGALDRTDRVSPVDNPADPMNLLAPANACAPGYLAIAFETTGATEVRCLGLCAALETDSSAAHVANERGDPLALAKLPRAATAAVGRATCGDKGSTASSACVFLWPAVLNDQGIAAMTTHTDRLGYCRSNDLYRYDADGNGSRESPYPSCTTLPPRSTATPGAFDDAADWGCQHVASSGVIAGEPVTGIVRDFRVLARPPAFVRHSLL